MNYYDLIHSKTLYRQEDENNEEYADRCWLVWKKMNEKAIDGVIELEEQEYTDEDVDEGLEHDDYETSEFNDWIEGYIQDSE